MTYGETYAALRAMCPSTFHLSVGSWHHQFGDGIERDCPVEWTVCVFSRAVDPHEVRTLTAKTPESLLAKVRAHVELLRVDSLGVSMSPSDVDLLGGDDAREVAPAGEPGDADAPAPLVAPPGGVGAEALGGEVAP